MEGRCTIDGTILQTIFTNEENGYTVLRLVTNDGEVVTVVGTIPCAAAGENLIIRGRWVNHPTHGTQVQAEEIERHLPTTESDIISYLSSGLIKGVGPAVGTATGLLEDTVRNEILTGAVGLHDGLNHVLRHIRVVGKELLGVLRQTVTSVAKGRIVVMTADAGI